MLIQRKLTKIKKKQMNGNKRREMLNFNGRKKNLRLNIN